MICPSAWAAPGSAMPRDEATAEAKGQPHAPARPQARAVGNVGRPSRRPPGLGTSRIVDKADKLASPPPAARKAKDQAPAAGTERATAPNERARRTRRRGRPLARLAARASIIDTAAKATNRSPGCGAARQAR